MKKVFCILIILSMPFVFFAQMLHPIYIDEQNIEEEIEKENIKSKNNSVEVSFYLSNRYAVGDMAKFSGTNLGAGISAQYVFPFLPILGVSGRAEVEGVVTKNSRADKWTIPTFCGGAFVNLPFGDVFTLRPELSYGVMIHFLEIEGKKNIFTDQIVQLAVSMKFTPKALKKNNFGLEIAPIYTLLTEKKDAVHYIGFRVGANYQF